MHYDKESDRYSMLIQNWWPGRQFIEMSSVYFASCGGQITFVTKQITALNAALPVTYATVIETDLDQGERQLLEGKLID